jgi:AcrB/AcrD/AcrF family
VVDPFHHRFTRMLGAKHGLVEHGHARLRPYTEGEELMRWIIASSLRFRLLVLGIAVGIVAVGITQLPKAPVDVLPEFTPPYAEVQTEAPGLSAEEVEQLITVPMEADLLNGVQGVDTIRSESVPGVSSITMVFEPGTDIYRGRQLIQERLTQAHALQVDRAAAPDGRPWRRQRVHLGHARPGAAGAGRPAQAA